MRKFSLEPNFRRAFDLVMIDDYSSSESEIDMLDKSEITLIEIKSTKKRLESIPHGFFFGATANEFDLAERLGSKYKFCFVCLHPETLGYALLTLKEVEGLIKTKRTQYQINLTNEQ